MTSDRAHKTPAEVSGASADRTVPKRSNGDGRVSVKENRPGVLEEYIRQHPIAATAVAIAAGLLLQAAVKSLAQRPAKRPKKAKSESPSRRASSPPASTPRTHDFGTADMKFTTHHPDGKNVMFKFVWKKRPTGASETDWPTDEMGFTAERPNGKQTAFTFKSKTRPIPKKESAVGDSRPGLGQAAMEFTSSAPGRRDFRFTWNRVPAATTAADNNQRPELSPVRDVGSDALSAGKLQKKRPAKKTRKKKTSKKKTAANKASKSSTSR